VSNEGRDALALRTLVAYDAAQRINVDDADRAARGALAGMAEVLTLDHDRAVSRFTMEESKGRVDAFRAAIARVEEEESRLLAERTATERGTGLASLAGGVFFALATVYVLAIAWRTRREADLSHALAEERATLLEFHERFVAVLGHDLRNPLSTIRMANQAILRRQPSPDVADKIRRADAAAHRMVRMIEQILDFARVRLAGGIPIEPKPADVGHVLEQTVGEARAAHPDRTIRVQADGELHGRFDEDRLAQVFSNLLGNAIVHSPPATPIEVRIHGGDPGVTITVSNEGEVPEALRGTLFDPFRRGERETKSAGAAGLGLGLYISDQIVRRHGGSLEVASGEGKTRFTVRLPTGAAKSLD
jgi:signal transduction histidine kinase